MKNWLSRYFNEYISLDGVTDQRIDHALSIETTIEKIYSSIKEFNRKEWINTLKEELSDYLEFLLSYSHSDSICLYMLDKYENNFRKEVFIGKSEKNGIETDNKPQVIELNDRLIAAAIKNRSTISVLKGNGSAYNTEEKEDGCVAVLPILVKNQFFGVVFLENNKSNCFQEDKLRQFKKTVSFIEKYMDLHIDRFASENRGNLFQAFFEINEIISVPQNKQKIYDILINLFSKVFECDRIIFTSFDLKKTRVKIERIYGIEDVIYEGQIIKELSNMQRVVIETKSPLYIKNLTSDNIYGDRFITIGSIGTNLTSLILAPIIAKERVIGSFQMEYIKPRHNIDNYLPIFKRLGSIIGSVIEKLQLYKKMEKMATLDYLTGLYLKREFVKFLKTELERSRRTGLSLSLLMIDIDKFKTINDTYGHLIGDKVLKSVAQVILSSIRNIDIAARYAGDEFCVILLNSDQEQAKVSAERIRKNIANVPVRSEGKKINTTVSIGASVLHNGITNYRELLKEADEAMYYGRRNGLRNISTLYDYDNNDKTSTKL